ncbi:MAG: hypothetical protein EXS68_00830 [Candidatus Ryanbacteria bacterium]|nr:hypothetical protein [Candidatus Ryanbacteria bacterium]
MAEEIWNIDYQEPKKPKKRFSFVIIFPLLIILLLVVVGLLLALSWYGIKIPYLEGLITYIN